MSIVGPRPTLRYQVDQYTPFQLRRLEVRPGITGWAQVLGRNQLTWPQRIELDVWYVDNRSVWLDLRLLARTLPMLARPTGVYNDARGDWGERSEVGVGTSTALGGIARSALNVSALAVVSARIEMRSGGDAGDARAVGHVRHHHRPGRHERAHAHRHSLDDYGAHAHVGAGAHRGTSAERRPRRHVRVVADHAVVLDDRAGVDRARRRRASASALTTAAARIWAPRPSVAHGETAAARVHDRRELEALGEQALAHPPARAGVADPAHAEEGVGGADGPGRW